MEFYIKSKINSGWLYYLKWVVLFIDLENASLVFKKNPDEKTPGF